MNGHSLAEAVDGFLESVVAVKRISVRQGIEQFIAFRKGKTVAAEGRRPQLSAEHWRNTGYWLREFADLRFQFGTSKSRGGRRYLPYAFTQEGIAMLSSVLRSPRAVAVNVEIMRAFVRMRRMLLSVDELARKVEALERKAVAHDQDLEAVFKALKQLIAPPQAPRREFLAGSEWLCRFLPNHLAVTFAARPAF